MSPDIIVITGPTASGKTELAIRYAYHLRSNYNIDADIINADSVQLYNELKILTAQPSNDQQKQVYHHLYGILPSYAASSVALWLNLAHEKINQLRQQNKVSIICGGTGMYISALINGISNIPQIPQEFRDEALKKFQHLGRDSFFQLLETLDPELCKTLHKNNTQRILRAYEVVFYTGKPLSVWWKEKSFKKLDVFSLVLLPLRIKLWKRCLSRIEKMIQTGALDEVEKFISRYPNYTGPLSNTIGYREIISFLDQKISLDECVQLMHSRTMQYPKDSIRGSAIN